MLMLFPAWLAVAENYWSVGIFCVGLWVVYAVRSRSARARFGAAADRVAFTALTALAVTAFRWPVWFVPRPLNPDEARMGAQALKALAEPWPWQGFDGGTSGPLSSYVLALPVLFGAHLQFFWIHFAAAALGIAIVSVFAIAAEAAFGLDLGRACSVVPLAFFALVQDPDFLSYSSEFVPMLLIASALAVLAYARAGRARAPAYALAGVCLGLTPFAKLQMVPLVLYLLFLFGVLLATDAAACRARLAHAACVFGAAFAAAALVVASTAATGSLHDAYISYVAYNLLYGEAGVGSLGVGFFLAASSAYAPFAIGLFVLLVVAAAAALWSRPARADWADVLAAGGLLAVAVVSIEAAHRAFPHYLTLAVVPAAAVLGTLLRVASRARVSIARHPVTAHVPLAACVATVLVPILAGHLGHDTLYAASLSPKLVPDDPIVTGLRKHISRGSIVAVWGWMPEVYVYTGSRMATKDADTYEEITPGRYRDYFRDRFMTSLRARPPLVFVDSVAPGSFHFNDRSRDGFETFPALRDFVAAHYDFVDEIAGIRVFRLRSS